MPVITAATVAIDVGFSEFSVPIIFNPIRLVSSMLTVSSSVATIIFLFYMDFGIGVAMCPIYFTIVTKEQGHDKKFPFLLIYFFSFLNSKVIYCVGFSCLVML